jgi:soluble lytic murein transglycosylase-like protein
VSFRNHCFWRRLYPGVLAGLLLGVACPSFASSGKKYVALRVKNHYDYRLTYADVQKDPARYVGRVFELCGTVGGAVKAGESLSIMLNLPDKSAPDLEIPKEEVAVVREYVTPTLRVLVKVGVGGSGNVVPLTVLAVAHDSEVHVLEAESAARAAAAARAAELRRQAQWRQQASRAANKRHPVVVASRGDFLRAQAGDAAAFGQTLGPRVRPLFDVYFNFIAGYNPRLNRNEVGQITFHLLNFADHYDVDPRLVVAMIIAESGFNPNATSRTGAMGLGQLMPGTARALGVSNAYDPVQNLNGSIAYLRSRLDTFAEKSAPGGQISFEQAALAMAAYNAGANAVKKYRGIPPYRETQAYVRRVISIYQQLKRGD